MIRFIYLCAFLLVASTVNAANHCVILQYHHFSDKTPAITSITPKQFDDQIEYLKTHNFNVMNLRDVALSLQHQIELPEKCVALTVDDAFVSVYETAYPRLKKLGWPMTVFVNSESIDKGLQPFMSWGQMREMSKQGFSFENHGHAHKHMIRKLNNESDNAWINRVRLDIQTAQDRITREIGIAPTLFAYPYGEYNPKLMAMIQSMGFTGFGQQSGPAWPDANFGALPRFPMAAQFANLKGFITKVNTLPLPVVKAAPSDPLTPLGEWRPSLKLQLASKTYSKEGLRCYISGSDQVAMDWSDTEKDTVLVSPRFDLKPGRHRTNCTMPSRFKGRFHWYSHNWFVRNADGSWYPEY